jgi:oxygen-independent coproporphyrinogen III oxidase
LSENLVETTIELNPETVTRELLTVLKTNFIQRLSIGVQSFDDSILSTLGRNTNASTTIKALEILKEEWGGLFSIDLINTVPGQTVEKAISDIKRIDKFEPEHISLYNLTFEKSTKLYSMLESGKLTPISDKMDSEMQRESINLLKSLGYDRYEISNFSKPGKQSLHNLNYWRMGSYIGVGPSAASTLLSESGPLRLSYKRSTSNFISDLSIEDKLDIEIITYNSFLLEHLMMGFRLIRGIEKKHIDSIFEINIENYLKPVFEKWGDKLHNNTEYIFLTEEGLTLLNPFLIDIATVIDNNYQESSGKNINWPYKKLQ